MIKAHSITLKDKTNIFQSKILDVYEQNINKNFSGLPLFSCTEHWGDLRRNYKHEKICKNLAQKFEKNWGDFTHISVLVNLTFTDVMSSDITVYSRRNTTLTVGNKESSIWNYIIYII